MLWEMGFPGAKTPRRTRRRVRRKCERASSSRAPLRGFDSLPSPGAGRCICSSASLSLCPEIPAWGGGLHKKSGRRRGTASVFCDLASPGSRPKDPVAKRRMILHGGQIPFAGNVFSKSAIRPGRFFNWQRLQKQPVFAVGAFLFEETRLCALVCHARKRWQKAASASPSKNESVHFFCRFVCTPGAQGISKNLAQGPGAPGAASCACKRRAIYSRTRSCTAAAQFSTPSRRAMADSS